MLRTILEELGLFALPFLVYAAVLLAARHNPLHPEHWEEQWLRLVLSGLFVVVASLVMTGLTAPRHPEGYVPPHMENGRLVPGAFK